MGSIIETIEGTLSTNRKRHVVLTIGTTTRDVALYAPHLKELTGQKHLDPAQMYVQPGGSAINTTLAYRAIAEVLGVQAETIACTKLGRDTEAKHDALRSLNHGFYDGTVIDVAYLQDYEVPCNVVIISKGGLRDPMPLCEDDEQLQKDRFTPFHPDAKRQIENVVERADILLLHSRYPELLETATEKAKEKGIPVVLDLSEKLPEIADRLENVINNSDYILAPSDALLPGMREPDADRLFKGLIHDYGRNFVAVSNSADPVKIYNFGNYTELPVEKVAAKDETGAGDLKIAAFGFFLLSGDEPIATYEKATALATLSVQYLGRKWTPKLKDFVQTHPLFAQDFAAQPGRDNRAAFSASAEMPVFAPQNG